MFSKFASVAKVRRELREPFTHCRGERRGSFLLIALGVLVCLVLYSVSYFNYMMMQKRLSDRMGKEGVLGKTALALATLAIHKMQFGPLLAENSGRPFPEKPEDSPSMHELFSELGKPLKEMKEKCSGEIDLGETPTSDLKSIIDDLTKPLGKMGEFSSKIEFLCRSGDFEEIGLATHGYPREKRGFIRLFVTVSMKKSGGNIFRETFSYRCRLKVAAALTPVLSKFTLYMEQAIPDGKKEFYGYNLVGVNEMGDTDGSSPARPLVLNHDGRPHELQSFYSGPPVNTIFSTFVQEKKGLVYFGGAGHTILNLARSDRGKPNADSGEGFHMFRLANGDGFFPIVDCKTYDGERLVISQMEQGMSNSKHENNRSFYDLLSAESKHLWPIFRDELKLEMTSIFRLCGVQGNRSPTLVLGNVRAQTVLARMYEFARLTQPPWSKKVPREKLFLYDDPADYARETENDDGKLVPLHQAGLITNEVTDLSKYWRKYSSFVASRTFNLGLAYMYNQNIPDPWTGFPPGDPMFKLVTGAAPEGILHDVPEPFSSCGFSTLKKMDPMLQLFDHDPRCGYEIEIPTPGDPDLWTALQRRGLLLNNVLSLSGWILIRSKAKNLVLDRELKILGNGGIILEEGDIEIVRSIRTLSDSRDQVILQIVARKGNIRLRTPEASHVQAALVANGRIIFANQPGLVLRGALAMKKLCDQVTDLEAFPGGYVRYFPALSALPTDPKKAAPPEENTESPLLSYQFELLPIILD